MEPTPDPQPAPDDGRAGRDRRAGVLLALSDALRDLADPVAVATQAMRTLREALAADRCAWAEADPDGTHFTYLGGDCAPGVAEVTGRWPFSTFGADTLSAGRPLVVADARRDLPAGSDRRAYDGAGLQALLAVPLRMGGRLVAAAGVHSLTPRTWSGDEVALVEDVVQRCWEAVARARGALELERRTRELEHQRQRLALALMVGRSGTFEWDAVADRSYMDDELLALYGLSRDEASLVADAWLALVHPDDRERMAAAVRRTLVTGSRDDEFRILRRDDAQLRWIHSRVQAFYDADGRATRVVGIQVDVTERRRAEDALRANEAQFRRLADGVPVMIWATDAQGLNRFSNLHYCAWMGTTREEARDHDWHAFIHPEDLPAYASRQREAVERGSPMRARARARRADGEWRWIESFAVPRLSDDGRFLGLIGTSIDVTDRIDARRPRARAERRDDALLAALSDALRRPLAPELDAVRRLAATESLSDEGRRALETIERALLRAGGDPPQNR